MSQQQFEHEVMRQQQEEMLQLLKEQKHVNVAFMRGVEAAEFMADWLREEKLIRSAENGQS